MEEYYFFLIYNFFTYEMTQIVLIADFCRILINHVAAYTQLRAFFILSVVIPPSVISLIP